VVFSSIGIIVLASIVVQIFVLIKGVNNFIKLRYKDYLHLLISLYDLLLLLAVP
jgi:hypothetical protein